MISTRVQRKTPAIFERLSMDWMKITVLTTTAGADLASQLLMDAGSAGTMIEDKNDVALNQRPEGQWDILDESIAARMSDDVKVSGYYEVDGQLADKIRLLESELRRVKALELGFDAGRLEIVRDEFAGEDWAESWKRSFKPIRLSAHMVVKPNWTEYLPADGEHVIEIDPGMAFGTGTHETTGMCAELIEKYVQAGSTVIDVGTGTGILAMVAAHMGAKDVLATDIDPIAVRVAEENVAANDLKDRIRCAAGNLLENIHESADVVIANIIADAIVILAAPVQPHIHMGGRVICSGMAFERRGEVLDALNAAN